MVTLSLSDSVTILAGQCHYADGIVTPSPNVLFLRFSIGKIEAKLLEIGEKWITYMQEYAESGGRYAGKMVIYAAFADQVG